MNKKIIIFDTTLRDGEQSPGASLNPKQKLEIAKQLTKLGVDVIEAGFPVSSSGDFLAVKQIAKEIKTSIIAALARTVKKDIDACVEALKFSKNRRIHTFIATSDIHLKYKLKKTKEQVLEIAKEAVKYARKFSDDVEFSCEDAVRTDFNYLVKVIEEVIKCGATTINIPDTVGYAIPSEFGELIKNLMEKVENIHKVVLSVHCHNDLGLAVSNSLSALINGAKQIECTINGIGERAGNASLEEIVMSINVRKDFFKKINIELPQIDTKQIYKTSKLVSTLTGIYVQPNKAIVGLNAFSHEAGIHQDGVLKKSLTYEIMTPQSVGISESQLILGKHSGRHAFKKKLIELGFKINEKQIDILFNKFKELADKKKYIFDEDIIAIIQEKIGSTKEIIILDYFHISSGSSLIPTATVKLKINLKNKIKIVQESACGDGPVDAVYKAIDKIIKSELKLTELPKLTDYTLRSVSIGKDAMGEVTIKIKYSNITFTGKGISTDIIEASIKAYINTINKIVSLKLPKIWAQL